MEQYNVRVSICCLVYNHEKYLRQCLDGFLMQKTNFKYEIIVHDDASTDSSADIIREYAAAYPDLIKPIFQHENQYSKNEGISWTHLYPAATGDYIATCEGDDYWTDETKLQRQFDIMEQYPDVTLCTHKVRFVFDDGTPSPKVKPQSQALDADMKLDNFDVIFNPDYCPFHTTSFFFRRASIAPFFNNRPAFIANADVEDYPLQLLLAAQGSFFYLSREMSCYRAFRSSNWSAEINQDSARYIGHIQHVVSTMEQYNRFTNDIYQDTIAAILTPLKFKILRFEKDYHGLHTEPYLDLYRELPPRERLSVFFTHYFPALMRCYKKCKGFNRAK